MGLLSRLVASNDTVMALAPLLDSPPWARRGKGGALERYTDNKWRPVPPAERLRVSQADAQVSGGTLDEAMTDTQRQRPGAVAWAPVHLCFHGWHAAASGSTCFCCRICQQPACASPPSTAAPRPRQVWLALNNLLVEPKCRAKYELDEYRKEALYRLKRYMNELLFDQLPVLKDLQRVIDEITLNIGPDAASYKSARLILEQVAGMRTAIMAGRDWKALAAAQAKGHFGPAAKRMAKDKMESLLKAFEAMCEMEPAPAAPGAAGAGPGGGGADPASLPVKVDSWRKVKEGVWEPWAGLELSIATDKPPEPVTLANPEGGAELQALRYRLNPLDLAASRPLPSTGKVHVVHGDLSAEALLQLPILAMKTSEGPAALWITVGLLAADGFALQLKLKKADKPKERDAIEGVWFGYHAVGGAITRVVAPLEPAAPAEAPKKKKSKAAAAAAVDAAAKAAAQAPVSAAAKAAAPAASAAAAGAKAAASSEPPSDAVLMEVAARALERYQAQTAAQQDEEPGQDQDVPEAPPAPPAAAAKQPPAPAQHQQWQQQVDSYGGPDDLNELD